MSIIISSNAIRPIDFPNRLANKDREWNFCSELISLPSSLTIPLENEHLAQLPDLRFLRSFSRAGLILCRVAMSCLEVVKASTKVDPLRVGLYCGVDQGPLDYSVVEEIAQSQELEMGSILLRSTKPKQIFKTYPNYSTNQVGIILGVQGPMQTFTSMTFGSLQALEQAEFDLWHGVVDLALVGSSNSLEDPMVNVRLSRQSPAQSTLSEGGAALVLARSSTRTKWLSPKDTIDRNFYGIADPLVKIVSNKKN